MHVWALFGNNMMEEDSSIPWEVRLLQSYCRITDNLDALGYAKQSPLAGLWYIASQTPSTNDEVCLCGEGRLGEYVVRQWVEYYVTKIRTETLWDSLSHDQLREVMEELNTHLATRIFMVGFKLSLADIVLYYGLHRYLAGMSFIQKADYTHVCRWFDQVQHFPGVRPFSMPLVVFHKNPDMLTH